MRAQIDQNFRNAKESDHDRRQSDAIAQHQNVESEAGLAGDGIEADTCEKRAKQRHEQGFIHGAVGQVSQRGQTEQQECGIFRRTEVKTKFRERRRQKGYAEKRGVPPIKEPNAAMPSAGPARPWRAMA